MTYKYHINGYLVGTIWMPAVECYKDVNYSFVRHEEDRPSPFTDVRETLRDALLHITNDGDFQSCELREGQIEIEFTQKIGTTTKRKSRFFDLTRFKSVNDMVSAEEFFPPCY